MHSMCWLAAPGLMDADDNEAQESVRPAPTSLSSLAGSEHRACRGAVEQDVHCRVGGDGPVDACPTRSSPHGHTVLVRARCLEPGSDSVHPLGGTPRQDAWDPHWGRGALEHGCVVRAPGPAIGPPRAGPSAPPVPRFLPPPCRRAPITACSPPSMGPVDPTPTSKVFSAERAQTKGLISQSCSIGRTGGGRRPGGLSHGPTLKAGVQAQWCHHW